MDDDGCGAAGPLARAVIPVRAHAWCKRGERARQGGRRQRAASERERQIERERERERETATATATARERESERAREREQKRDLAW